MRRERRVASSAMSCAYRRGIPRACGQSSHACDASVGTRHLTVRYGPGEVAETYLRAAHPVLGIGVDVAIDIKRILRGTSGYADIPGWAAHHQVVLLAYAGSADQQRIGCARSPNVQRSHRRICPYA